MKENPFTVKVIAILAGVALPLLVAIGFALILLCSGCARRESVSGYGPTIYESTKVMR